MNKTMFLLISVVALGALLVSCDMGKPRFRPEPERLRVIEPLDLAQVSQPSGEEFNEAEPNLPEAPASLTLTLEEARAAALEHNLDLQVGLLSPTIARESITVAEAQFESLVFANMAFSKTDQPVSLSLDASKADYFSADVGLAQPLRTGGGVELEMPVTRSKTNNPFSTLNPAYTSDFSASISQPLLRNAGVRTNTHAIRVAIYQTQIVEARTKLQVLTVLYAADVVYWRLYATRRALEVVRQDYELAVELLEQAQRRAAVGDLPEVEVIRAQAAVAERLDAVIIAENEVRTNQRELKRVLNRPDLPLGGATQLELQTEPNPRPYHLAPKELIEIALAQRMELLELELQLAQDASTIDYGRNQVLPLLDLVYRYNVNGLGRNWGGTFDVLHTKDFEDHYMGVQLQLPLGNEAAQSRLRQSMYTQAQRLVTHEQRSLAIRQEVYDAMDRLEAAWQRILATRQSTVLAHRTFEAERRQFELGLRTATDVSDAQLRLANQQLAEIRAVTEYEIAQVDLALASGTLLGAARIRWEPAQPQLDR